MSLSAGEVTSSNNSIFSVAGCGASGTGGGRNGGKTVIDMFFSLCLYERSKRAGRAGRVGCVGVDWRAGGMTARGMMGLAETVRVYVAALEKRWMFARSQTLIGVGSWPVRVRKSDEGLLSASWVWDCTRILDKF